jgi:nucleotide-binding universal stress UspA family protein
MSIKTIIVPMTGTKADRPALDAALAMATTSNAHIQAFFPHPDPRNVAIPQVGEGTDGITTRLAEVQGELHTNVAKAGRMADIFCMVQPGENDDAELSTMLTTALMETGKMVMLTPGGETMEPIKSVAIGWNGSREAARAVALAMPIPESAETVIVLAGTSDYLAPDDVNAFTTSLTWHGVKAKAHMFNLNGQDPASRLQAEARDRGAQLLVLGAYSHSRLREFVFGGVTDDIINSAKMPVLMAH